MKIHELYEDTAKKVIAVMPGGFHPFHPGHKSLYDWAVDTFGQDNVFVAATNDTTTRPFPFEVKQKLAGMAGVPTNRFIQVKSPFNALSYNDIIGDASQTALVFIRSEKDKTSHPLPDQIRKSDGNMGYLISYNGKVDSTADTHGYLAYGPTINFDFSGMSIKSASELRSAWPDMQGEDKMKAAELMYPGNGKTAVELLDKALGSSNEAVTEAPNNPPVAQKITPLRIPTPPKAPDATIPRTRNGHTTNDGVTYTQDRYNENIMNVENAGGTFTFDGARLIRWKSPSMRGYSQIHDLVRRTIKVDANTTVNVDGEDVLISTNAVYDLEGNLKNAGELGLSSGGFGVSIGKEIKFDYTISDNLSMHFRLTPNEKNAQKAEKLKSQLQTSQQSNNLQSLINLARATRQMGGKVVFKSPANGRSIPYTQGMEMLSS